MSEDENIRYQRTKEFHEENCKYQLEENKINVVHKKLGKVPFSPVEAARIEPQLPCSWVESGTNLLS